MYKATIRTSITINFDYNPAEDSDFDGDPTNEQQVRDHLKARYEEQDKRTDLTGEDGENNYGPLDLEVKAVKEEEEEEKED